ncbi:unnamed protein product [Prorocentrum cordatum]|uniref:AB hydrolase-1 domain-containing protein n=1 Tax=Prorocentrum cordatum TaxID=2364126 RepID=A0ABN9UD15_9DINO|nr:unnamed protein product [Polarella glacialis]
MQQAPLPSRRAVLLAPPRHAAWCWDVHFLDYFRARGFDAYALSLRGHGGSGQGGVEDGTVEMHAGDVAAFVEHVHRESGRPVVLVGHSFGGLFVQSAASRLVAAGSAALAGAVLLSSVPPSGNAELGKRYFQRDFVLGARLTWAMVTRAFERDLELSRLMFFGQGMPLEQVGRYTDRMGEGCPPGARLLDLRRLSGSLPVEAVPPGKLPVMVAGGDADVIVDREALEETARAHGVEAVILEGVAHDAMLDLKWEDTANAIADWIERKT